MTWYQPFTVSLEFPAPAFPASFQVAKVLPTPGTKLVRMAEFFNSLRTLIFPLCFEIISTSEDAYFQLAFAAEDAALIERQIETHFPSFVMLRSEPALPLPQPTYALSLVPRSEAGKLKNFTQAAVDPYQQLFSLLDRNAAASSCIRLLIAPMPPNVYRGSLAYLQTYKISPETFHHQPEIEDLIRRKHSLIANIPDYMVQRIERGEDKEYYGDERRRLKESYALDSQIEHLLKREMRQAQDTLDSRAEWLTGKYPAWLVAVDLFSTSKELLDATQLTFRHQWEMSEGFWQDTVIYQADAGSRHKYFNDTWSVLSTDEVSSLAHFPGAGLSFGRLEVASTKTKLPPAMLTEGEVEIGSSAARGQTKRVFLPDSVRTRHLYIVGKSGSGKSTLITNIAVQDIERGEGVCVIDPHGDLVSDLLDYIPERRVKDTIYFNVSDRAHPIGLDMMSAKSEAEIEILTDDLITTFRRLTETWGERMETILRYAFNTLLRTPGATFLDLQRLLTNEGWRSTVVRKLNFPPLTDFWYSQFPNMPKDAAQPILSRMTKIVLSPTLNAIFGRSEKTLNFNDVIRNRKILLINLGGDSRDPNNEQLSVSDEMKKLIGSVVVSQLQLAAMRQASIPENQRVPCRFFVDEFQNFVSGAFPKILSEARKYKLSLTVAHQYISQLDDATRNAIFGNVGTMVVMPLSQKDAAYLGAELGAYTPEDVANLSPERYEALCRPTTMAADTFLFTTLPPPQVTESFADVVINHTRAEYSTQDAKGEAKEVPAVDSEASPRTKRPMQSEEKTFASTAEKVLYYVSLAGYLTTSQVIELCYSHLSETSKRPAASRDLKKLMETKKLKSMNWGDGKVYYVGSSCNPTSHNVALRDILIRIVQSGFEVAEVNFSASLGALSPDLLVTFLCEDGTLLPTYWEYDTGTEGITEILKKIARYAPRSATGRVAFVCTSIARVQAILKATSADFIECAVLGEFTGLSVPAFVSRTHTDKYSFF